ncbi:type II restriction/modification system DNA methylase subunit YeeA [Enterovirga rhinocerotis]|uniref:site-specific DNA-methyltransferase (adenine-specific) n=2 Tax=Enterovirga rhinocerotis TaxID=1339210 RepID=A0A4R7C8Z1_9HYPH|nr:DNA methyltransferase [Enterovirga rhinocerotis]TDR94753.1 type II restriction/modification system DNA methylase subunit YeeA [Enterovirga rhinocerotis]
MQSQIAPAPPAEIDAFIARWSDREGGQERANYGLFLLGLIGLLRLPSPDPAGATHEHNDYVFERAVPKRRGEAETTGRIDLYKRDCFVLEAKQSRLKGNAKEIAGQADLFRPEDDRPRCGARGGWDVLMLNAKRQAEDYARALPASHGWPPFILVCDVGRVIEVFADFSGQGRNYTQFPDRQSYRIRLEDLREAAIRDRLRAIWLDPTSLDPGRIAARATRRIAERLAAATRRLERAGHAAEEVAHFLMRCLFTMFAADVGLLPRGSFRDLLRECRADPEAFPRLVGELWEAMDKGSPYAISIRAKVMRFNGSLFREAKVLPLGAEEIGELAAAAEQDWREVEPAIFGTLLEQALDPADRRRLGAHYTPRAYVERLVVATVIEPLQADWRSVQSAAEERRAAGDAKGALAAVRAFHEALCQTRVLDPACGTGNFLYVALELMKKLEGEVLEALVALGGQESLIGLGGHTIDPHNFLGLEINPRAAAIAELVLWIGYLQLHFRMRGGIPEQPILKAFRNIRQTDAILTWDGAPVPAVTGGRETYPNPRRPDWPAAEFIVGNPPFIGGKDLRGRLGDGHAEALWAAHRHINPSADLVMYWWDRAAELLTRKGTALRRFGFVTTNSVTQDFSRRVMKRRLDGKAPISLVMAIPDHPWTKATPDAAAVRIAMTVAEAGAHDGALREVLSESGLETDQPAITFADRTGRINPDLTVGVDVTSALPLRANAGLCSPGVKLHGAGFIVTPQQAEHLGLGRRPGLERHILAYRNGRDLTARPRGVMVIDLFGLTEDEVRLRYPEVYQHVLREVRDKVDGEGRRVGRAWNARASYRESWWVFGEPRTELRPALDGLSRYVATVETARHRTFQLLPSDIMPDNMLVCIAAADALQLGILSSHPHLLWSAHAGGTLEDRPRYTKSACFDPFPFPAPSDALRGTIRAVAEELDAFRKARQAEHPELTLTGLYNVLEALKAGRPLDAKEEAIRDRGLVLILKELHDRLDRLVMQAYGWPPSLSDEAILERLVALNRERAKEEREGLVRWLRPDYQIPLFARDTDRQEAAERGRQAPLDIVLPRQKPSFPAGAVEQSAAIFAALASATSPMDAPRIASVFRQGRRIEPRVAAILASASRIGALDTPDGNRFLLRRAA